MRFTLLQTVAAVLSFAAVNALPTISTKGSYFFTSDGDRWFVKGVAYQLTDTDPLIDSAQCALDAALMKTLGANTIRVYHVEAGADHSSCMSTFADAGIYLFVDLDTFSTYIVPGATPDGAPQWTSRQQSAYEAVMDEFQQYTNTAGFFIGNEVVLDPNMTESAVYVKAATKDLKAYRDSKGYRNIPIGYSHADVAQLRPTLQNYLACGSDTSASLDFFGLNSYEWCGTDSSYEISGYQTLNSEVMSYPIPIFFSETGCHVPEPRTFDDQASIFGTDMAPYWSGAIVYEWIQEVNHFGLITYGDDTNALITSPVESATAVTRSGTPTPVTPDFSNLKTAWAAVSPSSISASDYTASNSAPTCPTYAAHSWEIAGDVALPTLGETYNADLQYSISAGHAKGATGTGTSASAAAAATTSSATSSGAAVRASSGGKELIGVVVGLGSVMLGFIWWL